MPLTLPANAAEVQKALRDADEASAHYNDIAKQGKLDTQEGKDALDQMLKAQRDALALLRRALGQDDVPVAVEDGDKDTWITLEEGAKMIGISRPSLTNNLAFYLAQGIKFWRVTPHRVKVSKESIEAYQKKLVKRASDYKVEIPDETR